MAQVVLDRAITEDEWDALVDPDGGRYEILDGQLVVTPSGDADHSRYGEDLADILRMALETAGLDLPVTLDVEWRTIAANVVSQAPRGDVVIGTRLDPITKVHADRPLLVAEIWSTRTRPSERNRRRTYWASRGIAHYWEILLGHQQSDASVNVYDLSVSGDKLHSAAGDDVLAVTEPFPIQVTPAAIHGWTRRELQRANREAERANNEAERADQAELRAERERQAKERERAAKEQERAAKEQERQAKERETARADTAEERLAQIELRQRDPSSGNDKA